MHAGETDRDTIVSHHPDSPTPPPREPDPLSRGYKHLLWLPLTLSIAAALSWVPFVFSAINLCGVSGCSGGGYGVSYGPLGISIALNLLIGLFFFLAAAAPPWGPVRRRITLSGLLGLGVAALLTVSQLSARFG